MREPYSVRGLLALIAELDPSRPGAQPGNEDARYARRNALIYLLLSRAARNSWPHGIQPDKKEPGYVVIYVELPGAGQVSWHVPEYGGQWDKHDTKAKYDRVEQYVRDGRK